MSADLFIGSRSFSPDDQLFFARLSGDWNPMHMDPIYARRTQAGGQVVHGMHAVFWCLEQLARHDVRPPHVDSLEVSFLRPVLLGETVSARITRQNPRDLRISVDLHGLPLLRLTVKWDSLNRAEPSTPQMPLANRGSAEELKSPRELHFSDISGRSGMTAVQNAITEIGHRFPAASTWLGAPRLQALAALSYVIGMECPGLHSIFAGLAVKFADQKSAPTNTLSYAVAEIDERHRLVRIDVAGGGLAGQLEAFARMPPATQESINNIAMTVHRKEFAGDVALIVGGSRGLGEVTAKIIAAGGGNPIITYVRGANDAAAVRDEIVAFGGACTTLPYDVRKSAKKQLRKLTLEPRYVYYFATGPIFQRKWQVFQPELLEEFLALYVKGFRSLCSELLERSSGRLYVFYPSSSAVGERPQGMTEYAMAKAAGEILCRDMGRFEPRIEVIVRRLPRIRTDQTATMTAVVAEEAFATMLPIVRELQSRARVTPDGLDLYNQKLK
jgi:acyl dehydratase/NAD(P)-dependent dehydrogenase (short-subunit alcohol dehydrogenase family)